MQDPNFLRTAMREVLDQGDACFEFLVLQTEWIVNDQQ